MKSLDCSDWALKSARAAIEEAFSLLEIAEVAASADLGEYSPAQWAYAARGSICPRARVAMNVAARAFQSLPESAGSFLALINAERACPGKPFSDYTIADWAMQAQLIA